MDTPCCLQLNPAILIVGGSNGYPSNIGYYINIQSGEYSRADIDDMTYAVEEREVGNSSGSPKTYMYYEFID